MVTRRYLEKKSTVLGLPMYQVGLLVLLMVILIILSSFLKMMAPQYRWFNHMVVLLLAGGYLLLRYAASRRHPSYLASLVSYRLLQCRKYYLPTTPLLLKTKTDDTKKDG